MNAIIVGLPKYVGKTFTVEELKKLPEFSGKFTEDLSEVRLSGGFVRRQELDGQPILNGFCGPMWDGNKLRYETWEVYERMSV